MGEAYCRFFSMLVLRSSISSMGDEEERRELSEGLNEVELLSPCSTDRELGLSSKACATDRGTFRFSQHSLKDICQHLLKITNECSANETADDRDCEILWRCCQGSSLAARYCPSFNQERCILMFLCLPSCFWPAPRWRSPAPQHWASLNWTDAPKGEKTSGYKWRELNETNYCLEMNETWFLKKIYFYFVRSSAHKQAH